MLNMLKQQMIGIINLSIPFVVIYQFYPAIFFAWQGVLACSIALGLYVWHLHRKNLNALTNRLIYKPTGQWKEMLEQQIQACNIKPENIQLFYAYTNEALAMAAGNSIIIDPLACNTINDDPEALKVLGIINPTTDPSFSDLKRLRMQKTQEALSCDAQSFIFKHELGHVVRNYSQKKLVTVFLTASLSAYAGIIAAMNTLTSGGIVAIIMGMLVGGLTDLILSYLSNATFKAHEEKQADIFAIQFSSPEEIKAAATFFEQHQSILDTYGEPHLLHKVPSIILSGHLNGKTRAALLRSYL